MAVKFTLGSISTSTPERYAMTPPLSPSASSRAISRERFRRLAAEWKDLSQHMSNPAQMAMLRPYQKIIGMGADAVPFILEELRREPDQWFWALEAITDENPVPADTAGKVRQMAQAWIEWGKGRGLLPE